jgi:hypothetical protein
MKNTYPVSRALLLANVLAAGSMVANAQAVTLDFSGIVTSSTNVPSVLTGMTTTGSYTIDLANDNPYSGSGCVNYFASWVYAVSPSADGNPLESVPVSPPVLFDSETIVSD